MIFPPTLANKWIYAWNNRDLEAVLALYANDIQLRSPFAKVYSSDGIIKGKDSLRDYWTEALRRIANLKFELVAVYAGHQAMTLHYDLPQRKWTVFMPHLVPSALA